MQPVINITNQQKFSCQFQSTKIFAKLFWIKTGSMWIILVVFERFEHVAAKILS